MSADSVKRATEKLRADVYRMLGDRCERCGFNHPAALQLDHVNGGGSEERRSVRGHLAILRRIRNSGDTTGYRLLCANCNWISRAENKQSRAAPRSASARGGTNKARRAAERRSTILNMDPAGLPALLDAIRHLHGLSAKWLESVPVKESHEGATVWEGEVQVFEVSHPKASRVYAWSHESGPGGRRRFHAVLGASPVSSPEEAVRVAIVGEFRSGAN